MLYFLSNILKVPNGTDATSKDKNLTHFILLILEFKTEVALKVNQQGKSTCKLNGSSWILVANVRISRSDKMPDWSVSTSSKI